MNQYLLHVSPDPARQLPPWQNNLFTRGVVVMQVNSLPEAIHYCKIYSVLTILLEIAQPELATSEFKAMLREAAVQKDFPPILGLMAVRPDTGTLAGLAEAGLADVISTNDPDSFILWRLDLLLHLKELQCFEKDRASVADLAQKTRLVLHDMSQPLSAVQGRLQLLAAKCTAEDPNAPAFQELVRLSFEITRQLMEIQQLHRQYS